MEMGRRAKAVVELVKARTRHESVEVADYQNGLMLLSTTGLALHDVLVFLLSPVHNVLINLIGLHYCLFHLGAQVPQCPPQPSPCSVPKSFSTSL